MTWAGGGMEEIMENWQLTGEEQRLLGGSMAAQTATS